jgi:hypothetical protein
MNGPWHYREAERLLAGLKDRDLPTEVAEATAAVAQAHAALANAAAVIAAANLKTDPAERHEWLKAIDPEYAAEQAAEVTR